MKKTENEARGKLGKIQRKEKAAAGEGSDLRDYLKDKIK
jgi:hypothetical protein